MVVLVKVDLACRLDDGTHSRALAVQLIRSVAIALWRGAIRYGWLHPLGLPYRDCRATAHCGAANDA